MNEDKIEYSDIKDYERLFTLIPSFLLERYAKKNANLVLKFKSTIQSFMNKLNENQLNKLDIVLNSDVEELQRIMEDAYVQSNKKQYKVLANPKYNQFVEINMDEVRKMVE